MNAFLGRNDILNSKNNDFYNAAIFPVWHGFVAARLTWPAYVDGRKFEITLSEKIALLLQRHVDVPCSLIVT